MNNDQMDGALIGMLLMGALVCLFIAGYAAGYSSASKCVAKHPLTAAQECVQ